MDSQLRAKLKRQIQAYQEKHPNSGVSEVSKWLKHDNHLLAGSQINQKTLKSFVLYQVKKFQAGNDVTKHIGGNGRPPVSKFKQYQIKRLSLNKENRGVRGVALRVGVSHMTVCRVLKKAGAKPYHKYKTQKLTENHKVRRVGFAKWMLLKFGSTRPGRNLRHLINTDFSAKIRVNPSRNSKNDVVWATSSKVKEHVAKKKCETLNELKKEITRVWKEMDADKPLLARLMASIPVRCKAVVEANGDQIR